MTVDEAYVVNVEGAVFHKGRYLMIMRSHNDTHAAGALAFIGGKVENAGTTSGIVHKTLRREIREEVGVEVGEIVYVTSQSFFADDNDPVVNLVFLCKFQSGEPRPASPDEVEAVEWLTPGEIAQHPSAPPWLHDYLALVEAVRERLGW